MNSHQDITAQVMYEQACQLFDKAESKDQLNDGIKLLKNSLSLLSDKENFDAKDYRLLSLCHAKLADACNEVANLKELIESLSKAAIALEYVKKSDEDHKSLAKFYDRLGMLNWTEGNYSAAHENFADSLKAYGDGNDNMSAVEITEKMKAVAARRDQVQKSPLIQHSILSTQCKSEIVVSKPGFVLKPM